MPETIAEPPRRRLGQRLVDAGLITPAQLDDALGRQRDSGEIIGRLLVQLGYVEEHELLRELCAESGIPFLGAGELAFEDEAVALVPPRQARASAALPLRIEAGRLLIAMSNPFDIASVTALERSSGRALKVVGARRDDILLRLEHAYGERAAQPEPAALRPRAPTQEERAFEASSQELWSIRGDGQGDESSTAAQICEEVLRRGIAMGATDIHVEPQAEKTRIRYRVDGLLQEGGALPRAAHPALLSRFKIMSELNIAESRLPQDGRFRFRADGRDIDLRISTFPTLYGEDVVLRILDRGRVSLNLDELGIAPDDLLHFREAMQRPHGLIAVTGPTGSGKTTTLYSGLTELNRTDRCVLTLEDPIEYELAGVRQAQINVKAGLTFGAGLRSMLRHDPDVILVGEMRDRETVQIALSAALTGHLVLTTLHTNTAAGAIPRLLDMGAEPYLLSSALQLLMSQRLVRRLCPECRVLAQVPEATRQRYGLGDARLFEPRGCAACRHSGFKGRLGIFEVLPVTEQLAARIHEAPSEETVRGLVERTTLMDDGLSKVRAGITSLNELLRVIAG